MNVKLIVTILVLTVLFSCKQKTEPEFAIFNPTGKDKLILGKVAEIIPLETTKESFLDYVTKSYIDKKNNRIIVNADMNIFLFDAGGKFISKLKKWRSQLVRAFDRQYISEEEFKTIYTKLADESIKIKNFMNYLINSNMKGNKYK